MLPVVILAGGQAKRMRPLTQTVPKVLLPVANKPFIDWQLKTLRRNGVKHVILCLGYLGEQVERHINKYDYGMNITLSYDGEILLGTGGAIKKAIGATEKAFFILYGDSYLEINYADVERTWRDAGKLGLMTIYRNDNRWDSSNVVFEGGQIVRYSKTDRSDTMCHIDYGLGILSATTFVNFDGSFDLADVYTGLVNRGELAGYEVKNRFFEIGSLNGLKELEEKLQGVNLV